MLYGNKYTMDIKTFPPKREKDKSPEHSPPFHMPLAKFIDEYYSLMRLVAEKEKKGLLDPNVQPYEPVTPEEARLLEQDWKTFSRSRGFSEEDIREYARWRVISGQEDSLPGAINDPWRRTRPDWPKQLWQKHIAHAMQQGLKIPTAIQEEFSTLQKSTKQTTPTTASHKSFPNTDHKGTSDVW